MGNSTEKKIIDAFMNLAANETTKTSEYGTVSVKLVVEKANITKPTFYKYFADIYELIDLAKERACRPLFDTLDSYNPKNCDSAFGVIATDVIPYFYENQIVFRIMRNSAVDFNYQQYLENAFSLFFLKFLKVADKEFSGIDTDYLANYYSKVVLGILIAWISDTFPEAPETFREKFLFLINTPLNYFHL